MYFADSKLEPDPEIRAQVSFGETHVIQALASYFGAWIPRDSSLRFSAQHVILDEPESDHGLPSELDPELEDEAELEDEPENEDEPE